MNKFGFIDAFWLKVIALISMTIDHIGYFIYPDLIILRIIGRLAFVIFAFMIANGYLYTSNRVKHGLVLLIFGILIEIVLKMMGVSAAANIFITLALGYFLIYAFDNKKILLGLLVLIIPHFYLVDYGYYGVILIFVSYLLYNRRFILLVVNIILIYLDIQFNQASSIQYYSTIGLLLVCFYNNKRGYKMKYFFYIYYPLHIVIIRMISLYFIN